MNLFSSKRRCLICELKNSTELIPSLSSSLHPSIRFVADRNSSNLSVQSPGKHGVFVEKGKSSYVPRPKFGSGADVGAAAGTPPPPINSTRRRRRQISIGAPNVKFLPKGPSSVYKGRPANGEGGWF